MAKEGSKIPVLTKHRVREQLADETDPKAIKHLTAARKYWKDSPLPILKPNTDGTARPSTTG